MTTVGASQNVPPLARDARGAGSVRAAARLSSPLTRHRHRHCCPPTPDHHCPVQHRSVIRAPLVHDMCSVRPNESVPPSATDTISTVRLAGRTAGQDAQCSEKVLRVLVDGRKFSAGIEGSGNR
jgi:hypothetical protein